jgi:hypothetical protein
MPTCAAKSSDRRVSSTLSSSGDTCTIISVFDVPAPSACCSNSVSLLFRYGTCPDCANYSILLCTHPYYTFFHCDRITFCKFDNDVLMCFVSTSRSPSTPDSLIRSDPAKSTNVNVDVQLSSVSYTLQ